MSHPRDDAVFDQGDAIFFWLLAMCVGGRVEAPGALNEKDADWRCHSTHAQTFRR